MKKIANFIVKFRYIIFALFIAFGAYCVYGMTQTKVEYSISAYLSKDTDTKKALDIMDEEFYTYGSTTIMLKYISYEEAENIHEEILDIEGVKDFPFYNTSEYYKDSCALFKITFDGQEEDEITINAYEKVKDIVTKYDYYIKNDITDNYADTLAKEIGYVLIIAIIIIVVVLLLTTQSFMEVPVFLLTFGLAALMNMGTNYWLGTISFVSNSVAVILQLALAIDYAIIMANRYQEEKIHYSDRKEAMSTALAKGIPEIFGSSLTTISGLLALATMSLRLGADLGIVLTKSIIFSMLSVFLFMPALLLMFDKPISKTRHKSIVPNISKLGKFDAKAKFVLPSIFIVLVALSCVASFKVNYCFDQVSIDTNKPSTSQIAYREINDVFGYDSQFVIVLPGNDYEVQKDVLDIVESEDMVKSATGIANVEITNNDITLTLPQKINYREFAEFLNVDDSIGETVYRAYAILSKDDTRDSLEEVAIFEANKLGYKSSLLELFDTAFEHDDLIKAAISDNDDALDSYDDVKTQIQDAEKQLIGKNYSRIVFSIDGGNESEDTFALIDRLKVSVKGKYPDAIFAGDAMADYDLNRTFSTDNLKVSLFTILFVYIVLFLTFRNYGLPIPLVITIQGAIFINFAYFFVTSTNIFFFVYLIVSAIQMGATIDYAIVITSRYKDIRIKEENKSEAIARALNEAFPTILTSGTILVSASMLIGIMVKDPLISTLGSCLCRGCIISILSALLVIPCFLILTDKITNKTSVEPALAKLGSKNKMRKIRRAALKKAAKNKIEEIENDNIKGDEFDEE